MTSLQQHPTRRAALFGGVGLFAGALAGTTTFGWAANPDETVERSRYGLAFNTPYQLTVAGSHASLLEAALDAAVLEMRRVERASSVYLPDGELSRLNREGSLQNPDPHLVGLLTYADALWRDTDGRFDCTVQPLWDLWAARHQQGLRPSQADLHDVVARIDWSAVEFAPDRVRLRPGMAITLNSVNQGYAADVVMSVLRDRGVEHAFVNTGEFGARGRSPQGRGWRLGVAAPRAPDELAFVLDPFRRFAATSGDYKTFFSPDFRDNHIFTPRTGLSPANWSAVTVEASTGLEADGLSTALFTLDSDGIKRLLQKRGAVTARLFDKAGAEVALEV